MALSFIERPDSRKATENPRSYTLCYTLAGVIDDTFARAYVIAATPIIYSGLYRQDVKLDPAGYSLWKVEVSYGPIKQPEATDFKITFDTTGGSVKITQGISHINSYAPAGKTAPDHKGAIGVSQDGQPEGCDVVIPSFKWSETWQLPSATYDWSYATVLKALTGRVNDASFRGFDTGTVRFDGAKGSASNKDPTLVELTFDFSQSDDATEITAGDITGIAKGGWEYLWYEYEKQADATANKLVSPPIAAHVEQVYYEGDFSLLGIGTT